MFVVDVQRQWELEVVVQTYYRVMLGAQSVYAQECFAVNFIGTDYGITQDLTNDLPESWSEFNAKYIPIFLANRPEKTKIAAGLACGAVWTVSKGIARGDIVLSPDGKGQYRVGEVNGDYYHNPGKNLPHRRPIIWSDRFIDKLEMSDGLRKCVGAYGAVCNLTKSGYQEEIEKLTGAMPASIIVPVDETIEDPAAFVMEKHLEDFLVENWAQTELGAEYDIFEENGEKIGQQYQTDTGPLDILAISKDKKRLLVVELKKGKASDVVIGQILRYMGYVREELVEDGQTVHGAIIALEDDKRIRRALTMTPTIQFYRYQINFKLVKA